MAIALAVLVILALIGGGIAVAVARSNDDFTATINRCSIAADGSLTAKGTVHTSSGSGSVQVSVQFDDAATRKHVDRSVVGAQLNSNGRGIWTASGSAGDEVQRVTCVVARVNG